MYVAICKKNIDIGVLENNFENIKIVNSDEEFESFKEQAEACFVCGYSDEEVNGVLKVIRRSQFNYAVPVFIDIEKKENDFSDGCFSDIENTKKAIKDINVSLELLKNNTVSTWKNKLLTYLFCRQNVSLCADTDVTNSIFYYYPLVELFYEGVENYFYWLDDLFEQNILKRGKLQDRIFTCSYCFSARLRFTDHCPYCNSINIRQGDFLHCFTCGLVAPQEEFINNDRLICPRCNAKLKHFGEDYDRPLESGVCLDCGEYHVDSKLVAYCVDCNKHIDTDNLNKRSIYNFALSDFGRNQVQFNTIDVLPIFIDSTNYVNLEYFYSTLDWIMKMKIRFENEHFSLLGMSIYFKGNSSAYEMVVLLGKRLREILRTTDLCTRASGKYFWFLLPKTDKKGLEVVEERLNEFINNVDESFRDNFQIKTKSFQAENKKIKGMTAKLLIAELSSEL